MSGYSGGLLDDEEQISSLPDIHAGRPSSNSLKKASSSPLFKNAVDVLRRTDSPQPQGLPPSSAQQAGLQRLRGASPKPARANQIPPSLIPRKYHVVAKSEHPPPAGKHVAELDPKTKVWHTTLFPSLEPSSRKEAMLLDKCLDDMLNRVDREGQARRQEDPSRPPADFAEVLDRRSVLSIVYHELVRQVATYCVERAHVMARVWGEFCELFDGAVAVNERQTKEFEYALFEKEQSGQRELAGVRKELASVRRELDDVQARKSYADKENGRLSDEVARLQSELDKLRDENALLESEKRSVMGSCLAANRMLEHARAAIREGDAIRQRMEGELRGFRAAGAAGGSPSKGGSPRTGPHTARTARTARSEAEGSAGSGGADLGPDPLLAASTEVGEAGVIAMGAGLAGARGGGAPSTHRTGASPLPHEDDTLDAEIEALEMGATGQSGFEPAEEPNFGEEGEADPDDPENNKHAFREQLRRDLEAEIGELDAESGETPAEKVQRLQNAIEELHAEKGRVELERDEEREARAILQKLLEEGAGGSPEVQAEMRLQAARVEAAQTRVATLEGEREELRLRLEALEHSSGAAEELAKRAQEAEDRLTVAADEIVRLQEELARLQASMAEGAAAGGGAGGAEGEGGGGVRSRGASPTGLAQGRPGSASSSSVATAMSRITSRVGTGIGTTNGKTLEMVQKVREFMYAFGGEDQPALDAAVPLLEKLVWASGGAEEQKALRTLKQRSTAGAAIQAEIREKGADFDMALAELLTAVVDAKQSGDLEQAFASELSDALAEPGGLTRVLAVGPLTVAVAGPPDAENRPSRRERGLAPSGAVTYSVGVQVVTEEMDALNEEMEALAAASAKGKGKGKGKDRKTSQPSLAPPSVATRARRPSASALCALRMLLCPSGRVGARLTGPPACAQAPGGVGRRRPLEQALVDGGGGGVGRARRGGGGRRQGRREGEGASLGAPQAAARPASGRPPSADSALDAERRAAAMAAAAATEAGAGGGGGGGGAGDASPKLELRPRAGRPPSRRSSVAAPGGGQAGPGSGDEGAGSGGGSGAEQPARLQQRRKSVNLAADVNKPRLRGARDPTAVRGDALASTDDFLDDLVPVASSPTGSGAGSFTGSGSGGGAAGAKAGAVSNLLARRAAARAAAGAAAANPVPELGEEGPDDAGGELWDLAYDPKRESTALMFQRLNRAVNKTVRPNKPRAQVIKMISGIYAQKMALDESDERDRMRRHTLQEFVYEFFLNKYGLRAMAERHVTKLIENVRAYGVASRRIRSFGLHLAVFPGLPADAFDFLALLLSQRVNGQRWINGVPEDEPCAVNLPTALEAIRMLFEASYPAVFAELRARLEAASPPLPPGVPPELRSVDADEVFEAALEAWLVLNEQVMRRLRSLFRAADTRRAGALSYTEVFSALRYIDSNIPVRKIMRFYRESVQAGAGQGVTEEVFVHQCRTFGLLAWTSEFASPTGPDATSAKSGTQEVIERTWEGTEQSVLDQIRALRAAAREGPAVPVQAGQPKPLGVLEARAAHVRSLVAGRETLPAWQAYAILLAEVQTVARDVQAARFAQAPRPQRHRPRRPPRPPPPRGEARRGGSPLVV
eukprot:tig00021137_g18983.t1